MTVAGRQNTRHLPPQVFKATIGKSPSGAKVDFPMVTEPRRGGQASKLESKDRLKSKRATSERQGVGSHSGEPK